MSLISRIVFLSIVLLVIGSLHFLVARTFYLFLKKHKANRYIRDAVSVYPFIIFNIPYIYIVFYRFDFSLLPSFFYNYFILPFFSFQLSVILTGLYLSIVKVIKLILSISKLLLRKIKNLNELFDNIKSSLFYQKFDQSRRTFITTSTIIFTTYLFSSSALGMLRKDRWEITKCSIAIPNIPPRLKGTKIVLFSDIHSGPFMSYSQMREYCEIINNLNADIILIPGDFTDTKKSEIKAFNLAFRDLKAKYGIYGTLGNHDYFSDPSYISESIINETPIKMLRNDYSIVDIYDFQLLLLGIEDTKDSGTNNSDKLLEYLDSTHNKTLDITSKFKYKIPRILLAHKPYIFEFISKYEIDLMVSGHTHGGQIVLLQAGTLNFSIAATISKYVSGYYEFNNSKLYVSRGLGTVGMPIRVNCPPEITILELT